MESIKKKWLRQPESHEAFSHNENDYGLFNQWKESPERKALQQFKIITNESSQQNINRPAERSQLFV